jgi:hypothetical protein
LNTSFLISRNSSKIAVVTKMMGYAPRKRADRSTHPTIPGNFQKFFAALVFKKATAFFQSSAATRARQ